MTNAFWAAGLGFLVGVFAASFVPSFYIALLCAFLACAVLYLPRGIVISIFLFAVSLGMFRLGVVAIPESVALQSSVGEKVSLEGVVFEEPDIRERSTRLFVKVYGDLGVLVIAPLHVDIAYGDRVRAEGVLRVPERFDAGLGHSFNYPMYLAKDGIRYELSFASVTRIGDGDWNWLKGAALFLKQKYLEGLSRALPEPQAGLAAGITAGDKRGLGEEWSAIFRTVGLVHIVVLSGYNIMVVIGFIERLFYRAHRIARLGASIFIAVFFALMTGLASSSVRAAAMATIASVGKATGRSYVATRALLFISVTMVLWNPLLLAFDPGFQLSVIATWGLIALSPLVAAHLSRVPERFQLREIAANTIGTQLAVLPLILYQSGQLSFVALPTNLLALAAVPYAMFLSFIAGVGGLIAGPFAPLIAFPAYTLLSYILLVAQWAASAPFASVLIGSFSGAFLMVAYFTMITLVQWMRSDSRQRTS